MTDEKRILDRLRQHGVTGKLPVCGFYHPDDQAILRRLDAEGVVECWAGDGSDRGLLLARLRRPLPTVYLFPPRSGGAV